MKLLIYSDIHGDLDSMEKVLKAYNEEKADKILILGDLLYHGPRNDLPSTYAPKKVIELLNNNKEQLFTVRGNCDTEVDQMVLNFPILADYAILYLGGHRVYITHGHNFGENNPPQMRDGDILMNGHTHVPACRNKDNFLYINPGSVSIPKENSVHGYMTWEDGTFYWKDLDGTVVSMYKL